MLSIFVNVVLPVFIVAGIGFVFERLTHSPIAPFNQLTLWVLMPAFLFMNLLFVDFSSEEPLRITAFAFLIAVVMIVVGFVIARLARLDRATTSAFILTAAFPNLGNYGLPVVLLAFGQPGLAPGTLFLTVQLLYGLTLAALIASSGSSSLRDALRDVVRQPVVYAVAAALVLNLGRVPTPAFVIAALGLPAAAAVPVMLLVLGMNISTTSRVERPALVGVAVATRLVIGALVGWALVVLLGITGVARDVLIVGAAMPTAVYTILTATQFDTRPRFVSDVVVVSTLASIVTITVVLAVLTGNVSYR